MNLTSAFFSFFLVYSRLGVYKLNAMHFKAQSQTYAGAIMRLTPVWVSFIKCVVNSVLKGQLSTGSPSSVGPKLRI